jgi:hypothetical protein
VHEVLQLSTTFELAVTTTEHIRLLSPAYLQSYVSQSAQLRRKALQRLKSEVRECRSSRTGAVVTASRLVLGLNSGPQSRILAQNIPVHALGWCQYHSSNFGLVNDMPTPMGCPQIKSVHNGMSQNILGWYIISFKLLTSEIGNKANGNLSCLKLYSRFPVREYSKTLSKSLLYPVA